MTTSTAFRNTGSPRLCSACGRNVSTFRVGRVRKLSTHMVADRPGFVKPCPNSNLPVSHSPSPVQGEGRGEGDGISADMILTSDS